jgi:SRSO17 transposase
MVYEDIAHGVEFDWIGGDGLYGHSSKLTDALDKMDKLYVLDVHKDESVYLEKPHITRPEEKQGKGRKAEKLRADAEPIRADHYMAGLDHLDWAKVKVRKTAKGWLKLKVHVVDIWVWDGVETEARKKTLVITKTKAKRPETKYSFSNGGAGTYHPKEYAYFQAQRYWAERTFDDSKNELGMSDYQVRKWIGWHHHQSLVMFASLILLKQKIENETEFPLMSLRDARILIIFKMFGTEEQYKKRLEQMEVRHTNRKRDIDRYYRKEDTLL